MIAEVPMKQMESTFSADNSLIAAGKGDYSSAWSCSACTTLHPSKL